MDRKVRNWLSLLNSRVVPPTWKSISAKVLLLDTEEATTTPDENATAVSSLTVDENAHENGHPRAVSNTPSVSLKTDHNTMNIPSEKQQHFTSHIYSEDSVRVRKSSLQQVLKLHAKTPGYKEQTQNELLLSSLHAEAITENQLNGILNISLTKVVMGANFADMASLYICLTTSLKLTNSADFVEDMHRENVTFLKPIRQGDVVDWLYDAHLKNTVTDMNTKMLPNMIRSNEDHIRKQLEQIAIQLLQFIQNHPSNKQKKVTKHATVIEFVCSVESLETDSTSSTDHLRPSPGPITYADSKVQVTLVVNEIVCFVYRKNSFARGEVKLSYMAAMSCLHTNSGFDCTDKLRSRGYITVPYYKITIVDDIHSGFVDNLCEKFHGISHSMICNILQQNKVLLKERLQPMIEEIIMRELYPYPDIVPCRYLKQGVQGRFILQESTLSEHSQAFGDDAHVKLDTLNDAISAPTTKSDIQILVTLCIHEADIHEEKIDSVTIRAKISSIVQVYSKVDISAKESQIPLHDEMEQFDLPIQRDDILSWFLEVFYSRIPKSTETEPVLTVIDKTTLGICIQLQPAVQKMFLWLKRAMKGSRERKNIPYHQADALSSMYEQDKIDMTGRKRRRHRKEIVFYTKQQIPIPKKRSTAKCKCPIKRKKAKARKCPNCTVICVYNRKKYLPESPTKRHNALLRAETSSSDNQENDYEGVNPSEDENICIESAASDDECKLDLDDLKELKEQSPRPPMGGVYVSVNLSDSIKTSSQDDGRDLSDDLFRPNVASHSEYD